MGDFELPDVEAKLQSFAEKRKLLQVEIDRAAAVQDLDRSSLDGQSSSRVVEDQGRNNMKSPPSTAPMEEEGSPTDPIEQAARMSPAEVDVLQAEIRTLKGKLVQQRDEEEAKQNEMRNAFDRAMREKNTAYEKVVQEKEDEYDNLLRHSEAKIAELEAAVGNPAADADAYADAPTFDSFDGMMMQKDEVDQPGNSGHERRRSRVAAGDTNDANRRMSTGKRPSITGVKVAELQRIIRVKDNEISDLQKQLNAAGGILVDAEMKLVDTEGKLTDAERKLADADGVKSDYAEKNVSLLATIETLDGVIADHEARYTELQEGFDQKVKQQKSQEEFMAQSQTKLENLEEDRDNHAEECERLTVELADLQERYEEELGLREQAQFELSSSKTSCEGLVSEMRKLESRHRKELEGAESRLQQSAKEGSEELEAHLLTQEEKDTERALLQQELVSRYEAQIAEQAQEMAKITNQLVSLRSETTELKVQLASRDESHTLQIRSETLDEVRGEERSRYESLLEEQKALSAKLLSEQREYSAKTLTEKMNAWKSTQELSDMQLKVCKDQMLSMQQAQAAKLVALKKEHVIALETQKKEVKKKCKAQYDAQVSRYLERLEELQKQYAGAMAELQRKEVANKEALIAAMEKQRTEYLDTLVDKKLQIVLSSHMQQLDFLRKEHAKEHSREMAIVEKAHGAAIAALQDSQAGVQAEVDKKIKQKDSEIGELEQKYQESMKALEDLKRAMQEKSDNHDKEIAQLQSHHAAQLREVKVSHEGGLKALKAKQVKTVQGMEKIHNSVIAKIEKRHSESLLQSREASMRDLSSKEQSVSAYEEKMMTINEKVEANNMTIANVEKRYSEELAAEKKKMNELEDRLHQCEADMVEREELFERELEEYGKKTDSMYIQAMTTMQKGYEDKIALLMESISSDSEKAKSNPSAVQLETSTSMVGEEESVEASLYAPEDTAAVSREVDAEVRAELEALNAEIMEKSQKDMEAQEREMNRLRDALSDESALRAAAELELKQVMQQYSENIEEVKEETAVRGTTEVVTDEASLRKEIESDIKASLEEVHAQNVADLQAELNLLKERLSKQRRDSLASFAGSRSSRISARTSPSARSSGAGSVTAPGSDESDLAGKAIMILCGGDETSSKEASPPSPLTNENPKEATAFEAAEARYMEAETSLGTIDSIEASIIESDVRASAKDALLASEGAFMDALEQGIIHPSDSDRDKEHAETVDNLKKELEVVTMRLEGELKQMETTQAESDKVIRDLRVRLESECTRATIATSTLIATQQSEEALRAQLTESSALKHRDEEQLDVIRKQLDESTGLANQQKEEQEVLQKQISDLETDLQVLRGREAELIVALSAAHAAKESAERTLEEANEKHSQISTRYAIAEKQLAQRDEALRATKEELRKQFGDVTEALRVKTKALAEAEVRVAELTRQKEDDSAALEALKSRVSDLTAAAGVEGESKAALPNGNDRGTEDMAALQTELQGSRASESSLRHDIVSLQAVAAGLRETLDGKDRELGEKEEQMTLFVQSMDSVRIQYQTREDFLKANISELTEELSSEQTRSREIIASFDEYKSAQEERVGQLLSEIDAAPDAKEIEQKTSEKMFAAFESTMAGADAELARLQMHCAELEDQLVAYQNAPLATIEEGTIETERTRSPDKESALDRETERALQATIVELTAALDLEKKRVADIQAANQALETTFHEYRAAQEVQMASLQSMVNELKSSEQTEAPTNTETSLDRDAIVRKVQKETLEQFGKIFDEYKAAADDEISRLASHCEMLQQRIADYEKSSPVSGTMGDEGSTNVYDESKKPSSAENESESPVNTAESLKLTHAKEIEQLKGQISLLEAQLKEVVEASAMVDATIEQHSGALPVSPRTAKQRNSAAIKAAHELPEGDADAAVGETDNARESSVTAMYVAQVRELIAQIDMLRMQNERQVDEILELKKASAASIDDSTISASKPLDISTNSTAADLSYLMKIVHVQRVVRSYLARRVLMRKLKLKMAQETGVLVALRGTVQGQSGWYGTDKGIFYFSNIKGEWVHMLGPIAEEHFDHAFRTLRGMRQLPTAQETLRAFTLQGGMVESIVPATASTSASASSSASQNVKRLKSDSFGVTGLGGVMGNENLYVNPVSERLYVVSSVERHMEILDAFEEESDNGENDVTVTSEMHQ